MMYKIALLLLIPATLLATEYKYGSEHTVREVIQAAMNYNKYHTRLYEQDNNTLKEWISLSHTTRQAHYAQCPRELQKLLDCSLADALITACYYGKYPQAMALLKIKVSPNTKASSSEPVLVVAAIGASQAHTQIAKKLMAQGASALLQDAHSRHALAIAQHTGNKELVKILQRRRSI